MLERAERKDRQDRVTELSAQLETPPFPDALRYVWAIFWRLRRRIRAGMDGPGPITWADFHAFRQATFERLSPWEVGLIERLDDLYLNAVSEAAEKSSSPTAKPDDPEGFKAVLGDAQKRRVVSKRGLSK